MRKLITFFILALSVFEVYGVADSVKVVYFALNKSVFEPSLDSNAPLMDDFVDGIAVAAHSGTLDHVAVYGYASPDGPFTLNDRLSIRRCNTVAEYISLRAGIPMQDIRTAHGGVAWDGLRKLVAENPGTPSRDAVIRILDKYLPDACLDQAKSDQCRADLTAIDDGRTYKWMTQNLFPELRYAIAVYTYVPSDRSVGHRCVDEPALDPDAISAGGVCDTRTGDADTNNEDDYTATPAGSLTGDKTGEKADLIPPYSGNNVLMHSVLHRLAVKTNFLYDAALLPNLEVEWRVNGNWSVAIEGGVAWWGKYSKNRSYRLAMVSPEARYWIRPHNWWRGFYVGAFAGGVFYDFLKDSPGYRGDGVMGGLSVGYMWSLNRCLSLEAALGAGYLYTRYKEYRPLDGHHVYQRTKDINYFGPLKVKLSLVWRLWDTSKSRRSLVD